VFSCYGSVWLMTTASLLMNKARHEGDPVRLAEYNRAIVIVSKVLQEDLVLHPVVVMMMVMMLQAAEPVRIFVDGALEGQFTRWDICDHQEDQVGSRLTILARVWRPESHECMKHCEKTPWQEGDHVVSECCGGYWRLVLQKPPFVLAYRGLTIWAADC
jgi:hypothetical protein